MSDPHRYLAIDLGASHGRAWLGVLAAGKLRLEPVHDFPNEPVTVAGHLCWNVPQLLCDIKQALRLAAARTQGHLDGIGIDSWGVDVALFDQQGQLLGWPCTYRDKRTDGMVEIITGQIDPYDFYRITGVQLRPIYTLCQLLATVRGDAERIQAAASALTMAEAFIFLLTGRKIAERTMRQGSGLLAVERNDLCTDVLARFGIPPHLFPPTVPPGTIAGELLPDIARETGLQGARVIAPACHDTANLVAALPIAEHAQCAFMSSGTWAVVGRVAPAALITRASYDLGVTNMATWNGMYLQVLMFTSLWLIQECRRIWRTTGADLDDARLVELATNAPPGGAVVDPDDPAFMCPANMPTAITDYCRRTGQKVPQSPAEIARVIFDSLARKCRDVLCNLEQATGTTFDTLCIVGGGVRNTFLSQQIANATGKTVIEGPAEATVVGNVLIQTLATGRIGSLAEAQSVATASFPGRSYRPEQG